MTITALAATLVISGISMTPATAGPHAPYSRLQPPVAGSAQLFDSAPPDCPAGHSCYYDRPNGTGLLWIAPSCGFFDLGKMSPPKNDRIESIWNGGGAPVQPYNWVGDWRMIPPPVPVNRGATYTGVLANIIDAVQVCS